MELLDDQLLVSWMNSEEQHGVAMRRTLFLTTLAVSAFQARCNGANRRQRAFNGHHQVLVRLC